MAGEACPPHTGGVRLRLRTPALSLPSWWATATTVALCGTRSVLPGGPPDLDHEVDLVTVGAMRHGADFWHAMDEGLRWVYGPASTIRAYRMPTVFLVWRWLPSWSWWPLFVALAASSGWLAARLAGRSWVMPVVAGLLVAHGKGPGYTQYLLVEPWAVPCVLGCLLAYRRERWGLAVALALAAGLVREQAAVLLLLGLVVAVARRQPWRCWALGVVAWLAAFAVHAWRVSELLVADGRETNLLGTSHGWSSVVHMAAYGLPLTSLAAVLIYAGVVRALAAGSHHDLALLVGPYLLMPLVGFAVDRPYWGTLTVPVALAVAAGGPPLRIRAERAETVPLPGADRTTLSPHGVAGTEGPGALRG